MITHTIFDAVDSVINRMGRFAFALPLPSARVISTSPRIIKQSCTPNMMLSQTLKTGSGRDNDSAQSTESSIKLRGEWRHNFSMARLSTWKAGGIVRDLFLPADLNDLHNFYLHDKRATGACYTGHGSNLLVRDGGFDGVMVRTAPGLSQLHISDGSVYAEAGVGCPKLAKAAARQGLAAAAFLAGIPGTIGGALAMNAGCEGSEIWDYVEEVTVLQDGALRLLPASAFVASYRAVEFTGGRMPFLAAARLRFAQSDVKDAKAQLSAMLQKRNQKQPIGEASCGSVFCNPPNDAAAKLIEQCGLKGMKCGDAQVSDKHANFIINRGQARAADIENLIMQVQEKVRLQTGILLRTEVRIVGEIADANNVAKSADESTQHVRGNQ